MAVRITLDRPQRHLGSRVWRQATVLIGAALVLVGTAAMMVAIPACLLVLAWLAGEDISVEIQARRTLSAADILTAWAISAPVAILGLNRGMHLVRRGRSLVLFLRRFGYDDATSAVTYAVTRAIGHAWRIVTLDDAEIVAIGVPTGTRWIFGAVTLTSSTVMALLNAVLRVFPALQLVLWGIVAVDLVRARIWEHAADLDAWFAVVTPYFDLLFVALKGRLPLEAVALSLHGAFAACLVVMTGIVLGLGAALAAAPIAWAVSAIVLFFSSFSADAVREAERGRTREIRSNVDVFQATHAVAQASRKLFGARLVVLRVASSLWQQTVLRLAGLSSVVLIDVSEPTQHLVWEIESLAATHVPCVFIGHHDRVRGLAAQHEPADEQTRRVARLLEGEEVLAYTTDAAGMRRFAGALRSLLMERTAGHPRAAVAREAAGIQSRYPRV